MTSRRRCVTERRRLRRWRWLRQRRHFSRQRRRQRDCCSSQHPWRGHFSPILAEGRELQPPLQQFEFQFLQGLRTGRTERSRRSYRRYLTQPERLRSPVSRPPPLTLKSREGRPGLPPPPPPVGVAPPVRGGPSRFSPPFPGVGFRQRPSTWSGAELRLEPGREGRPPAPKLRRQPATPG